MVEESNKGWKERLSEPVFSSFKVVFNPSEVERFMLLLVLSQDNLMEEGSNGAERRR